MVVLQEVKANIHVKLLALHALTPLFHVWHSDMLAKQNASDNAASDTDCYSNNRILQIIAPSIFSGLRLAARNHHYRPRLLRSSAHWYVCPLDYLVDLHLYLAAVYQSVVES